MSRHRVHVISRKKEIKVGSVEWQRKVIREELKELIDKEIGHGSSFGKANAMVKK